MADGGTVPLGQVARVSLAQGPSSIRTENSQLAAYIFVDLRDRDLGSYVADAQKAVATQVKMPSGYYVTWSGQFEYLVDIGCRNDPCGEAQARPLSHGRKDRHLSSGIYQ